MSEPRSFGTSDVQSWVCNKLKYTGEKKEMATLAAEKALEWWVRSGDTKYGAGLAARALSPTTTVRRWRKDAHKECKAYIKANYKRYGFIWGLLLSILLQVVISAVAKVIVDWLFSKVEARVYFSEQAEYYRDVLNEDVD
jgi:hypothetical protein|tara:strand:- start:79 stop:498 length:420 start_codon:yes stop_codon:yes gene_type:complete